MVLTILSVCPNFSAPWMEDTYCPFSQSWFQLACQKYTGCLCVVSFLGFLFCSIDLHISFYAQTRLFWLPLSWNIFEIPAASFLLFKTVLAIWDLFCFHLILATFFHIWEESWRYFDWNLIESVDSFRECEYLNDIDSPNPQTWQNFPCFSVV